MAVWCRNCTERMTTLCGQNAIFVLNWMVHIVTAVAGSSAVIMMGLRAGQGVLQKVH